MVNLFIIALAMIIVFGILVYILIDSICSDDIELDIQIQKEIEENLEKTMKNVGFRF